MGRDINKIKFPTQLAQEQLSSEFGKGQRGISSMGKIVEKMGILHQIFEYESQKKLLIWNIFELSPPQREIYVENF